MKKLLAYFMAVTLMLTSVQMPMSALAEEALDTAIAEINEPANEEATEIIPETQETAAETQESETATIEEIPTVEEKTALSVRAEILNEGTELILSAETNETANLIWQRCYYADTDYEECWSDVGEGERYTPETDKIRDYAYRCKAVRDGEEAVSEILRISLPEEESTAPAEDATTEPEIPVLEGAAETLSVSVTFNEEENTLNAVLNGQTEFEPEYCWQIYVNDNWNGLDSSVGDSLSLLAIENYRDYEYRCAVTAGETMVVSEPYTFENPEETPVAIELGEEESRDVAIRVIPESSKIEMLVGDETTLNVSTHPAGYTLRYSSDNENIAEVDESGRVTAKAIGTCNIFANVEGTNEYETITIDVVRVAYRIDLNLAAQDTVTLAKEQTVRTVTATVLQRTSANEVKVSQSVVWESSAPEIVSVATDGTIKGLAEGSAVITAALKTMPNVTARYTVDVVAKKSDLPRYVYVKLPYTTVGVGSKLPISVTFNGTTADNYVLKSTNEDAVIITADGYAFAKGEGSATIKAIAFNGKSGSVSVTVKPAPKTMSLSESALTLPAGDTATLKTSLTSGSAAYGRFISSDESVAKVSPNGLVNAVSRGEAVITAETYNGLTDTCDVVVVDAIETLDLSTERTVLGKGEKLQLETSTNLDSEIVLNTEMQYESSNTRYATVDGNGLVTAKANGTVTVSATAYNGNTDDVTLKIVNAAKSPTLKAGETVLGVGESTAIELSYAKNTAGAYEILVSKPSMVEFTNNGGKDALDLNETREIEFTAAKAGDFTLYAKTYNNATSKSLSYRVLNAPEKVILAKENLKIALGDSYQLNASVNEGAASALHYSSANPAVVAVDGDGKVKAVGKGTTTVTVSTYNGKKAVCTITVTPTIHHIGITSARGESPEIGRGETLQLKALCYDADNNLLDVETGIAWTTSNKAYASITKNGLVKGLKYSTVTITAKAYNGARNTMKLYVRNAPRTLTLTADSTVLGLGESTKIHTSFPNTYYGGCTFASSDNAILTVNEDGTVTSAGKKGPAQIQARTYNGTTAIISIQVVGAPTSIAFSNQTYKLASGDSLPTAYTLNDGAAGSVRYTSNNPSIVKVREDGTLEGGTAGEATITATTYNDCKATAKVIVTEKISKINVTARRMEIGIKDTITLTVENDRQVETRYSYTSSNTRIAKVDADGKVTGVAKGKATILVKAYNGTTGMLIVNVVSAPSAISISAPSTRLGLGEKMTLSPVFKAGQTGAVRWVTGDASKVEIDERTGEVEAIGVGTALVGVQTYNNVRATLELTVCKEPESIRWTRGGEATQSIRLAAGDQIAMGIQMLPADAAGQITYTVTRGAEYASVDKNGVIKGLAKGTAEIVAETYNGRQTKLTVEVLPEVESLLLSSPHEVIGVGDSEQLTVVNNLNLEGMTYTFTSSNTEVLKIDSNGLVKASATGTARITVKAYNNVSDTLTITVKSAPTTVSISAPRTRIALKESMTLSPVFKSDQIGRCEWYSLSPETITVDPETGVITGEKLGKAVIGVRTHNGKQATVSIDVCPQIESLTLTENGAAVKSIKLALGDSFTPQVVLNPANAAGEISFEEMTKSGSVSVDANGKITALKAGSATVRVRSNNGKYYDCAVTVEKTQINALTISAPTTTLGAGETVQLTVTPDIDVKTTCTYTTSSSSIARVDANGLVTTLKAGTVRITAKAYNGTSAVITLTVLEAPTTITCKAQRTKIGVGDTTTMTVTTNSGAGGTMTVESLNPGIATVTDGVIKGIAVGTATLRVKAYNGKEATTQIEVVAAPTSIAFNPTSIKIPINAQKTVQATMNSGAVGAITYSGTDAGKVTVTEDGLIKAVGLGTASVKATTYNGKIATLKVEVVEAVKTVTIAPVEKMMVGDECDLKVTYAPVTGLDFDMTYTSSKPSVITVDAQGHIKAVAGGSADITATAYNGVKGTVTIEVWYAPSSISLKAEKDWLEPGETTTVTVNMGSASKYKIGYTLTSTKPTVASVNQDGTVTAKAVGTTEIECLTTNGQKASVTITVSKAPASSVQIDKVIAAAQSKLGANYVYGTSGPTTFDCSGFVLWAFGQVGVTIPHSAMNISKSSSWTKITSYASLKKGDILCFYGSDGKTVDHVGIYLGNNKMIHASQSKKTVLISTMDQYYWIPHFACAQRVFP